MDLEGQFDIRDDTYVIAIRVKDSDDVSLETRSELHFSWLDSCEKICKS